MTANHLLPGSEERRKVEAVGCIAVSMEEMEPRALTLTILQRFLAVSGLPLIPSSLVTEIRFRKAPIRQNWFNSKWAKADNEQGKQRRTALDLLRQLFSLTLTMIIFPVHRRDVGGREHE